MSCLSKYCQSPVRLYYTIITNLSEQPVCAALGRCRHNVLATFKSVFLFDLVTLLPEGTGLGLLNFAFGHELA